MLKFQVLMVFVACIAGIAVDTCCMEKQMYMKDRMNDVCLPDIKSVATASMTVTMALRGRARIFASFSSTRANFSPNIRGRGALTVPRTSWTFLTSAANCFFEGEAMRAAALMTYEEK